MGVLEIYFLLQPLPERFGFSDGILQDGEPVRMLTAELCNVWSQANATNFLAA